MRVHNFFGLFGEKQVLKYFVSERFSQRAKYFILSLYKNKIPARIIYQKEEDQF